VAEPCRRIADAAAADVGIPVIPERCLATLEANFLAGMGLSTLGIASGGRDPHSACESLPVVELERLVALLDAILARAAD
jgi:di/tripeptidase